MEPIIYDLSQHQAVSIHTVSLRQTNGHDERQAHDGAAAQDYERQLILRAIVAVNGQPVGRKPEGHTTWSRKTWRVLTALFNIVNGVTVEEVKQLLGSVRIESRGYVYTTVADPDTTDPTILLVERAGFAELVIRELVATDEAAALKQAAGDAIAETEARVARSIVSVNGRALDPAEAATWYHEASTRTRILVERCYAAINELNQEDVTALVPFVVALGQMAAR
jgi:hypothetical protein